MCAALLGLMLECSTSTLPVVTSSFGAVDSDVDVSGAGNLEFLEAGHGIDSGDNFFCNLAGRFAEFTGKFECDGEGVLSELDFRGLLDDYVDVI
jgi:hypothetical protein